MFHGGAKFASCGLAFVHDFMKVQQQPAAKKRSARYGGKKPTEFMFINNMEKPF